MSKIIGIDLGTTNSCVAIMDGDKVKVIENAEGDRTTPSIIAYTDDGETLVGQSAKRQAVTNPQNTIFSVKRFMGRKFDEIGEEIKRIPYKVVKASNGDAAVEVDVEGETKQFSPPEISAMILGKLKADAETRLRSKGTPATRRKRAAERATRTEMMMAARMARPATRTLRRSAVPAVARPSAPARPLAEERELALERDHDVARVRGEVELVEEGDRARDLRLSDE